MEKGFFHPDRGYWQAVYPEGTIEVPLKPGPDHEWQDGEWVHVPPPEIEPTERSLDRLQFEWLLAFTGLDDVWTAAEAAFKETDLASYADLRRERSAEIFRYDVTMAFVARMAGFIPEGVDLSPEAIAAAWAAALDSDPVAS